MSKQDNTDKFLIIDDYVIDVQARLVSNDKATAYLEPKVMALLCELARHPGEVCLRTSLIDNVWDVTHGGDESLTRAVSQLRKAFKQLGATKTLIRTVPKSGFVLEANVTWRDYAPTDHQEYTISPSFQHTPPEQSPSPIPATNQSLYQRFFLPGGIIFLLLGLIAVWIVQRPLTSNDNTLPSPIIEIAALELPSNAEPILIKTFNHHLLSAFSYHNLTAISPPAATPSNSTYKNPSPRITLTSAMVETDSTLTLTVTAHEPSTGSVLWTNQYSQAPEHLDRLLKAAPKSIAETFKCTRQQLTPSLIQERPDVLALFFKICQLRSNADGANDYALTAETLVRLAPDMIDAHATYASALIYRARQNRRDHKGNESLLAQARQYIEPHLANHPDHGLALWAKAASLPADTPLSEREAAYRFALTHDDTMAVAFLDLVDLLQETGRIDEAVTLAQRALALSPASLRSIATMGDLNARKGRLDAAISRFQELKDYQPNNWGADWEAFSIPFLYGTPDRAAEAVKMARDKASRWHISSTSIDCLDAHVKARTDASMMDIMTEICGGLYFPKGVFPAPRLWAILGEVDRAYEAMPENPQEKWSRFWLFFPDLKPLRHDRRFIDLAAAYGLTKFWTETGAWPDFCSDKNLPYDCTSDIPRQYLLAKKEARADQGNNKMLEESRH